MKTNTTKRFKKGFGVLEVFALHAIISCFALMTLETTTGVLSKAQNEQQFKEKIEKLDKNIVLENLYINDDSTFTSFNVESSGIKCYGEIIKENGKTLDGGSKDCLKLDYKTLKELGLNTFAEQKIKTKEGGIKQ